MEKALYWKKEKDALRCELCPQLCLIKNNEVGLCMVRQNIEGVLYTLNYGRISSATLDPIEKKPLYKYHPGSFIYSVGSVGCNLGCPFCQNFQISHPSDYLYAKEPKDIVEQTTRFLAVSDLVEEAVSMKEQGNIGIAYTYNEPFMSYEYVLEASKAAKERGLVNALVTNGYINKKPLLELLPFIDAMNIDLKGFREDVYKQLEGHLAPVKKTIEITSREVHVEVTNLIVPGLNDDKGQIEEMVSWLANLNSSIALHFSRYFPARRFKESPTPIGTLKMAKAIAKKKLKSVYLGNI